MWTPVLLLALAAQTAVMQGEIRNALSHEVIPFARVTLSSARTTVESQYTDRNGRFRFAAVPGGTYLLLSVDHPSYHSAELDGSSLLGTPPDLIRIDLVPQEKEFPGLAPPVSLAELMLPKNARKEFDRARTYVKRSRPDLAEQAFLKASALSDAPQIAMSMADLYLGQRRYKEAETVLIEAIRKHSDVGDLYHSLALAYFEQGRDDEAEDMAQQAHARKHGIADVHLLLAKIQLKRQNLEGVADQLEIYLREAPRGPVSERVRQDLEKYRSRP